MTPPVRKLQARPDGGIDLVEADGTTTPHEPDQAMDSRWELGIALDLEHFYVVPRPPRRPL